MAISYVGGQVGGRAGSTSTTNITYALTGGTNSTPQAGDFVVITDVIASAGRTPACAITAPATWNSLTQINANGTTYDTSLNVSYKFMGGTPDTTFTLPSTGNIQDAQRYTIQVWRGVDTTNPFDVTAVSASGTATGRPNPGSITPTTSGAYVLICGGGAAATGAAYTAPANYTTNFLTGTTADTNDAMVGSGYRAWTSGTEDPAAYTGGTANAVDSWASYTLALRPSVNAYNLTAQGGSYTVSGQSASITYFDPDKPFLIGSVKYTLGQTATPGSQNITVPSDAQIAVVHATNYSASGDAGLSMSTSFGTFAIQNTSATGETGVIGFAVVTATGAQTFTPTWAFAPSEGPLFFITFIKNVNTSDIWRDYQINHNPNNSATTSITLTTDVNDLVLVLDKADTSIPATLSGFTSLDTNTNVVSAGRLQMDDTVSSPSTTVTTGSGAYPIIVGISIKPLVTSGAYTLTANGGGYTIAGGSVLTLRSKLLTPSGGSYTRSSQSINIAKGRVLTGSGGSYTITGQQGSIYRNRKLTSSGGSYSNVGASSTILRSKLLVAQGGSYSYTGQQITITYTAGSVAYTLTAQGGSYIVTGQSVGLNRNRALVSNGGSYTVVGSSSNILKSKYISGTGGAYSITGATTQIYKSKVLVAVGGSYVNSGATATILRSKYLVSVGGSYTYAGQSINISRNRTLVTLGGAYTYQGSSASYSIVGAGGYPNPSDVLLGVVYGPSGEYTGTLDIGNKFRIDIATGHIVMIIDKDKVLTL